jgi:hypothetical protein
MMPSNVGRESGHLLQCVSCTTSGADSKSVVPVGPGAALGNQNEVVDHLADGRFFPEGIAFDGRGFDRTAVTAQTFRYLWQLCHAPAL